MAEPNTEDDTNATLVAQLSIGELLDIAQRANVMMIMAEEETNRVVVDYVPARLSMVVVRNDPDDEPLEAYPPTVIPITFVLEDAMFGGVTYVSLTCQNRVLVHPFEFRNYTGMANDWETGHLRRR